MRRLLFVAIAMLCGMTGVSDGWVRREAFTDPQKERLQTIDHILLGSLALTDQGKVDTASLQDFVAKRSLEIGYTVASNAAQPHDVVFNVKCEQRNTWGAPSLRGEKKIFRIHRCTHGRGWPANRPQFDIFKAATIALGNIGDRESTTPPVDMLQGSPPNQQVIAAKALDKVRALHGDTASIPPLLNAIATDDVALRMQIVWALRESPGRQAYEPLVALQHSLRSTRTRDRNRPEGKIWEAVNSSLIQLDGFDQNN